MPVFETARPWTRRQWRPRARWGGYVGRGGAGRRASSCKRRTFPPTSSKASEGGRDSAALAATLGPPALCVAAERSKTLRGQGGGGPVCGRRRQTPKPGQNPSDNAPTGPGARKHVTNYNPSETCKSSSSSKSILGRIFSVILFHLLVVRLTSELDFMP